MRTPPCPLATAYRGRQHANQEDHAAEARPGPVRPTPPPHPPPVIDALRYHRLRDRADCGDEAVQWTGPAGRARGRPARGSPARWNPSADVPADVVTDASARGSPAITRGCELGTMALHEVHTSSGGNRLPMDTAHQAASTGEPQSGPVPAESLAAAACFSASPPSAAMSSCGSEGLDESRLRGRRRRRGRRLRPVQRGC